MSTHKWPPPSKKQMTEAEYLHEGLSKVFDLLPGNPEAALYHCRKYLAGSSVTEYGTTVGLGLRRPLRPGSKPEAYRKRYGIDIED